jgi:hypothetical protein
MTRTDYSMPVAQLLTLGDPRGEEQWRDYLKLGFTTEHVPELIRLARDSELWLADSESKEVWANLHAWRTLGQLRAQEAIEPLLELFQYADDNDDEWAIEELPEVYALIGPAAIPALANYLNDPSHSPFARVLASSSITMIGKHHPNVRAECAATLARALEKFDTLDPELNAFLISDLCELGPTDYFPLIERAFASQRVDESVRGDWQDIQIEFGLITERTTPDDRTQLDDLRDQMASAIRNSVLINQVIADMRATGELKSKRKDSPPKNKKR